MLYFALKFNTVSEETAKTKSFFATPRIYVAVIVAQGPAGQKGDRGDSDVLFYDEKDAQRVCNMIAFFFTSANALYRVF